MPSILVFLALVAVSSYAIVHRLLVHKERMAALQAKRPKIVLQITESTVTDVDELSQQIIAACKAKGMDIDLTPDP